MPFQRQAIQTARARSLRQQDNPAEASMWSALRNRQLAGHKFVRQLPIGLYYADFACRAARLVVEIDGSQHVGSPYDQRRDAFMTEQGYTVLRFPSGLVFSQRDDVCDTILSALNGQMRDEVNTLDLKFVRPSPAALARCVLSRERER